MHVLSATFNLLSAFMVIQYHKNLLITLVIHIYIYILYNNILYTFYARYTWYFVLFAHHNMAATSSSTIGTICSPLFFMNSEFKHALATTIECWGDSLSTQTHPL
jgi:hypothetical protein